ncbi:MAG: glycosyltransferase family 2 protein [Candidatus Omnitrophica bacterium]|nr:glycosyltransferase family 2 protein [Candidatus Omnitrophota bacterium]
MPKILIIVPAYNEAGNIGRTVEDIRSVDAAADVLVIDDGSKDATAQEARSHGARVVSLPFNLGIGGAVQTGFQYAHQGGYDIAVQIDGDGQHSAVFLPQLLAPIAASRADMVIGSRFAAETPQGFKSTFGRRIGIRFFARLINALTGAGVTDPTSGFRAHNKKLIAAFARHYPHDFPEPEAIVAARRINAAITEVPVVMRARGAGSSSIRYFKSMYYMLKVTFAILLHMVRKKE